MRKQALVWTLALAAAVQMLAPAPAAAQQKKPNILVIWGDDIGYWNISAYNQGMMGYKTPNIDRIAKEGALFTDWYGEQSCTAGRSAFITGQSGFRTGNLKVGLPGAKEGLQARDVTLAQLLKAQGYMTAQFGKNHLGDVDENLPTAHGFDEFFGSLYHLNAEEEPENPDYFKDPELRKRYGTRGVIHTWANADGTQRIESTGPLNRKRMETIDEEVTKASLDYLEKAKKADKPFFLWWNSTRMHIWTHLKAESQGKTGLGIYPDGMVEHDAMVGQLLDKLKELGLDENTIVMYSTDNGAEMMSWPDGGTTPFRGEKNTNWEGGYRVPTVIRWPGVIKPGTVSNDIFSHMDMLPTIMAAAGVPDVKEQLLKGMKVGDKTFKVHLDGYNVLDTFAGKAPDPRHEFFYFNDDGSLVALRYDQWKLVFAEQRAHDYDGLAGSLRASAFPEALQPAIRSVRAGRPRGHRLSALAAGARLPARAGAGVRREVPGHVQGIPAEPDGGQLQPRPGDEDALGRRQQVTPLRRLDDVSTPGRTLFERVRSVVTAETMKSTRRNRRESPASRRDRGGRSGRPTGPDATGVRWRALLLTASGAAALIFQVLWIKQLTLIVGVDVYAVTAGVSAFFAGPGARRARARPRGGPRAAAAAAVCGAGDRHGRGGCCSPPSLSRTWHACSRRWKRQAACSPGRSCSAPSRWRRS